MIVKSASVSSCEPRLVNSVGFLVMSFDPSGSYNSSSLSSVKFPQLCLFDCGSLHLLPSVAEASLMIMLDSSLSIAECH